MKKLTENELEKMAQYDPNAEEEAKKSEPILRTTLDKIKSHVAAPLLTAGGIAVAGAAKLKPVSNFKHV